MSTKSNPSQPSHKLLAIPGPIEVSDEVLHAISQPPMSHVSPQFVSIFQECMQMTRELLFTKDSLPFIIAGSGTLGWDQVAANLVEPGENVLLLNTGYFGDSFKDCLETYGSNVDVLRAPLGGTVPFEAIETALRSKKYKVIAFTHVDTSTGVLSDAKGIGAITRRVSPQTLVALDGVCSVASEEIRMDNWGIDVVLTASQKGLGAPPGLSILVASQRALQVFRTRATPVTSYYASWNKWIPIMNAYDKGTPAYFATPPVNVVFAYHASLKQITRSSTSLNERFKLHRQASDRIKAIAAQLGYKQIPVKPEEAANGMTAIYLPDGLAPSDIIPRVSEQGVIIAGGLHKEVKDKYVRIGHMGVSVVDESRGDIDTMIKSLENATSSAKVAKLK